MTLLDRCNTMWGPLSEDCRQRLVAFLKRPSAQTWEATQSIVIAYPCRVSTCWQAWHLADPTAPMTGPSSRGKWERWPDPFTLRRGIVAALAMRDTRRGLLEGNE